MMLKRLFTSKSLNKLNCTNCRLYNRKTKICKINNLNALENRLNEEICGIDAKKYWLLDETNLIKSRQYARFSELYSILTLMSIPSIFYFDMHYMSIFTLFISAHSVEMCYDLSVDYKKKYFEDNVINEEEK